MTTEMKTVRCEAGHDFQIPKGRGRPPKFCREHKPVKAKLPAPSDVKSDRRPELPRQTEMREAAKVNPFIAKAKKQQTVERLQEGKAKAAVERSQAEIEHVEKEYSKIDDRISVAEQEYTSAFRKAADVQSKDEIDHAFNVADTKQDALMGLIRRKAVLEALVEQLTDPDSKPKRIPLETDRAVWRNSVTDEPLVSAIDAANDEAVRIENEEDGEPDGYNDLLSNPEQFDGPMDDFADLIEQELNG